jgi:hypothetical protein
VCSWGSVGFSTLPPVPETMRNGFSLLEVLGFHINRELSPYVSKEFVSANC